MGREVRRVPKGWKHPQDADGNWIPLLDGGFKDRLEEWEAGLALWLEGKRDDWKGGTIEHGEPRTEQAWVAWTGDRPRVEEYMPDWPESERTQLVMYGDTTEGTPISPAFDTPEELARWLVDNRASAFAGSTASYEAWLRVCRGGYAPSAIAHVVDGRGTITSGVEGLKDDPI